MGRSNYFWRAEIILECLCDLEQGFADDANARCQTLVAVKCFDFFMLLI